MVNVTRKKPSRDNSRAMSQENTDGLERDEQGNSVGWLLLYKPTLDIAVP